MIADANQRGLSPLGGLGLLGRVVRGTGSAAGDGSLGSLLRVQTDPMASPGGFVLCAELMHDLLHRVDSTAEMRAADRPGSYLLDEPEWRCRSLPACGCLPCWLTSWPPARR